MEPLDDEILAEWRTLKRKSRLGTATKLEMERLDTICDDEFGLGDPDVKDVIKSSNKFKNSTIGDDMSPARAAALYGKTGKKAGKVVSDDDDDDEEDDSEIVQILNNKKKNKKLLAKKR